LDGVRASADRQLSELEAVAREVRSELEERWPREWMKLMHGKRVLGEFLSTTPMRSVGDLVAAMAQAIADEPSLMPKGLAALKGRIEELRRE